MESDHLQQFLAEIEERICTCGAGHGSGEGHTDWCEWVEEYSCPPAPEAQQEPVAFVDLRVLGSLAMGREAIECTLYAKPNADTLSDTALFTRPSEQAVTEAWRPIETAPKDGTPVLLARFDRQGVTDDDLGPDGATVGHWAHFPGGNEGWYLSGLGVVGDHGGDYHPGNGAFSNNSWPELDPTHWMPLPTPPALASGESR